MKFSLDKCRVEKREIPDSAMLLELPHLPPSTNHLYFNVAGRGRVKTKQYTDWLYQAGLLLKQQVTGRLIGRVDIKIQIEDRHPMRDISNTIKPLEDLLVASGAISDDRSKFVRGVTAQWAPIQGIRILIERCAL